LACACDYRIMAKGPYKIGLNETLLGITAPFWLRDLYINTIGYREAEKALQLGKMYTSDEALTINLVDELAEPANLMSQAEKQMQAWLKIPSVARELTKSSMRRDRLSKLLVHKEADIEALVEISSKDFVQKSLKTYLESLKKSKKSTRQNQT
jgi:Delta3-Delta2-enoyl-CoA isomerase